MLAKSPQNEGFPDFEMLQWEIPKFISALALGERYFYAFRVGWSKSQVMGNQLAGDFNSFGVPHETP